MSRSPRIRCLSTALRLSSVIASLYALSGCTEHTGGPVVDIDGFGIVTEPAGDSLQEGGEPLDIAVPLTRGSAHRLPVMLKARDVGGDSPPLSIALQDNNLTRAETASVRRVSRYRRTATAARYHSC